MNFSTVDHEDINIMCTPRINTDFSEELRRVIHERNILTLRTRTKLLCDLDQMSVRNKQEKRESIRGKALQEIYTSEISYLQQLEKVIKYFMEPIKAQGLMCQTDFNTIFGNIETIYNVNGELLHELNKDLNNAPFAILKLAPFFKLYSFYAYDYKKAITILQNMSNTNLEFRKFLETQELCEDVQMKLPSLLITPIQRIPRYRLLLKQVLDHSEPNHPNFKKLQESLREVESTAEHINSLVEEHENIERMLEIQKTLQNNYPVIIKPGRKLLKEGILMKISRKRNRGYPRYFVLMSDIIMYCKILNQHQNQLNSLQCCCILPLNKCKIEQTLNNSFKLNCQHENFVLYSDTLSNTDLWINVLRKSICEYVECRKTLRKDSSKRQPIRKKYDIDLDYLGLSPGVLKQKRKFQEYDEIFYVNNDENETRRRIFPFSLKKRPLSVASSNIPETPVKKLKTDETDDEIYGFIKSDSMLQSNENNFDKPNSEVTENTHSKLFDLFYRISNSVKKIFSFK